MNKTDGRSWPLGKTRHYAEENGSAHAPVFSASDDDASSRGSSFDQSWGIAAVERTATIPFATESGDNTVSSFIPMLFFDNQFVFLRGTEGGVYLYNDPETPFQFSGLSRLRFVDIPADAQGSSQLDSIDTGFQLRYSQPESWSLDLEIMSDRDFRFHSNVRLKNTYSFGDWELSPSMTVRYKDADFNSTYYALSDFSDQHIGAGVDFNIGINARYHLTSRLHLLGSTSVTRLDNQAYQSRAVEDRYQGEVFFGIGFFEGKTKTPKTRPINPRYVRIAHGWATPSNLGEIIEFKTEEDSFNNQLTSLFYGHPLADDLLGMPLDIYLTPGVAHHWSSKVQSASTEYIVAIKAFYTFDWPVQWRFGVAEGLSYIDKVTYIEATELEKKDYKPSRLLNYLDFSLDVNVGDLFSYSPLRSTWLGYSIHHRSAIFEKSSQYGRIKGGSNYNTVYLQFDF